MTRNQSYNSRWLNIHATQTHARTHNQRHTHARMDAQSATRVRAHPHTHTRTHSQPHARARTHTRKHTHVFLTRHITLHSVHPAAWKIRGTHLRLVLTMRPFHCPSNTLKVLRNTHFLTQTNQPIAWLLLYTPFKLRGSGSNAIILLSLIYDKCPNFVDFVLGPYS